MSVVKNAFGKIAGVALLIGIVFGLFVVVVAPFEMYAKAKAETWPSRKGVVTLSYASHKRGSKNILYWSPEICGTYNDNGERFCVTRIRYGGIRFGEGEASAREAVARYPVKREVDVYYSPDNPRLTILEANSPWTQMYTLFGLGIALLLLPAMLWVFRKQIDPGSDRPDN